MARYGSDQVGFFLIDGFNLLGTTTEVSDLSEALTEDTTTLGTTWDSAGAVGAHRWELEQQGFFDDAVGASHDALADTIGASRVGSLAYAGNTLGKAFIGFAGVMQASYRRVVRRREFHKANGTYQGSGDREAGKIVHPLVVETSSSGATTDPVDNGAATTNGGAAYFQTTALALDGGTSVTLKLQHSTDDVTYADLATTGALTAAPEGQRVAIAGTINRYVQATWSFAGSAGAGRSVTFFAGIVRH